MAVAFDRLVETKRRHAVDRREVGIEQHALAADFADVNFRHGRAGLGLGFLLHAKINSFPCNT